MPMKPNQSKRKKHLPFRSRSRSWHATAGSNDNLVISFSEDDSEGDPEDSRAGHVQGKVDAVALKNWQGVKTAIDGQTVYSQKSLNSDMVDTRVRKLVLSSGMASDCKVNARSSVGIEVFPEKEAPLQKYVPEKGLLFSRVSENQVECLPQEVEKLHDNSKSQYLSNHGKRKCSSFCGDVSRPTDTTEGIQTHIHDMHFVPNPAKWTINEQENKRLKLHPKSHAKLILDESSNETMTHVPQATMCHLASCDIKCQSQPKTDPSCSKHPVGECRSSGAGMSANCNQHVCDTRVASAGLISDMLQTATTTHIEDACVKLNKFVLETLLGTTQMNQSAMLNFQEDDFMDFDSLMKLEELNDKELEEAQEIRHKCELAERQALKAYREAHKALWDANEKCTLIYRRREVFSAYFRSLMMDGIKTPVPPDWPKQLSTQLISINRVPKGSTFFSTDQDCGEDSRKITSRKRDEFDGKCSADVCDAKHSDPLHLESSKQLLLGQSLTSEHCVDCNVRNPDTKCDNILNGGNYSSSFLSMPTIGDRSNMLICRDSNGLASEVENAGGKVVTIDAESKLVSSGDNMRDLELEATLRSKLCARFSKKSTNGASCLNDVPDAATKVDKSEANVHGRKNNSNEVLYEKSNALLGANKQGVCEDISAMSFDQQQRKSYFPRPLNGINASVYLELPCILETVSGRLKFLLPELNTELRGMDSNSSVHSISIKDVSWLVKIPRFTTDTYSCDLVIDPFWPFCMFELRGRCNDSECQWQHLRDSHHVELSDPQNTTPSASGAIARSASKSSRYLKGNAVFVPTYRIGSDLIKTENLPCETLFSRSNWYYWGNSFRTSFFLPLSVQRFLSSNAPMFHGYSAQAYDNVKRHSTSSFGLDQGMKVITHGLDDIEQALELAIDLFNTKTNKLLGRKKALAVLARSLEENPNSPVLWIVYLNIYCRKDKDLEHDDMFFDAIHHNEDSYDLWVMYINSRMQFDSRMDAYNDALFALCHVNHTHNTNSEYLSSCILDLFLQMMDFFCISGNEKIAMSRMYALLDLSNASESSVNMLLVDILSCLVARDSCIFWICCIYFVVYQKLPQVIVEQFECEKDIPFQIEWCVVQLTSNEKQLALELMNMALNNLVLNSEEMSSDNNDSQKNIERSAHFMAVSHIKLVAAIQGLENSAPLMDRYLNRYPTCIELIKLCAYYQNLLNLGPGFECFEQALHDWPKEKPGLQCLWNQYAVYALDCNRLDIGVELMVRWFSCFCKARITEFERGLEISAYLTPGNVEGTDCGVPSAALPCLTLGNDGFCYNQGDIMFGFLNLFIYEVMKGDIVKAQTALDKALEEAPPDYFRHCVREHSSFCSAGSALLDKISTATASIITLLNGYLGDARCSRSQLLSRRSYQHLKKPRLKHLIDTLLGPVSADFSLLNSILGEWYGPKLLPGKVIKITMLIDYVECLLQISPANYKLAISAFNWSTEISKHAAHASYGVMFWASALLADSILLSLPVAPEYIWVEVVDLLSKLCNSSISERFHQQGLSLYPFSKKLWQSYYELSKAAYGNPILVVEAARERGIELT